MNTPLQEYPPEVYHVLELAAAGGEIPPEWEAWTVTCEQLGLLGRHLDDGLFGPFTERGLAVHLLGPKQVKTKSAQPPRRKLTREEEAIAVFVKNRDWTKKQIAAYIGCNEKQLAPSRMPQLDAAVKAYRAKIDPTRKVRRGTKDADGTLEAYDE